MTVVSVALSVAMVGLWLRSRANDDWLTGTTAGHAWQVESARGLIGLEIYDQAVAPSEWSIRTIPTQPGSETTMEWHARDAAWSPAAWHCVGVTRGHNWVQFFAPLPVLAGFAMLLPACRLMSLICRRSRPHQGITCIHCGYDLRATPDRCPECGTVPSKA
jgi:hypothetical protein